jgi:hypothetical protein
LELSNELVGVNGFILVGCCWLNWKGEWGDPRFWLTWWLLNWHVELWLALEGQLFWHWKVVLVVREEDEHTDEAEVHDELELVRWWWCVWWCWNEWCDMWKFWLELEDELEIKWGVPDFCTGLNNEVLTAEGVFGGPSTLWSCSNMTSFISRLPVVFKYSSSLSVSSKFKILLADEVVDDDVTVSWSNSFMRKFWLGKVLCWMLDVVDISRDLVMEYFREVDFWVCCLMSNRHW